MLARPTGKQATLSCQSKQQKKQYMNEYMRQKQGGQSIQAQINTLVFKEKRKQYMKEHRERKQLYCGNRLLVRP